VKGWLKKGNGFLWQKLIQAEKAMEELTSRLREYCCYLQIIPLNFLKKEVQFVNVEAA
jgi:hypothetical protein